MRIEFEYWYLFDFCVLGKDLIQNYLMFCIYNYIVMFLKEKWFKGFWCNGYFLLNFEKMFKLIGNFLIILLFIELFLVDVMRFVLVDVGDVMDDVNFVFEMVNFVILCLMKEIVWME